LIHLAGELYSLLILIRVILSWVPMRSWRPHPAVLWLYRLTEPVLAPARRIIPPIGGIDFSPLLVFWLLPKVTDIIASLFAAMGL